MVKFAHLADCHLGGWREDCLRNLNFESFRKAIDNCIRENLDFILISGDLFDSAYPPIEILKEAFSEFRRIKEAGIPVFLIAGSHDFSSSGKTFLDVLEKAGFCRNVESFEVQEDGRIKLKPTLYKNVAIFGYSGKKSGMEIQDLQRAYFDSIHSFTIFMLHTTIGDVVGSIPMEYLEKDKLPLANYYALGHIHQVFEKQEVNSVYVYPGPIFPNNFQELADLNYGSFQIVDADLYRGTIKTQNIKLKLKEVVFIEIEIENALSATEKIIHELDKRNLKDKICLLKLTGTIRQGKTGDINFEEIETFVKKKEAFSFLRNISSLEIQETEIKLDTGLDNIEKIEEKVFKEYEEKNPADFNRFLPQLVSALSLEKNEDEKSAIFESRLMSEIKKILNIEYIQ
jgi:hypothetical protein